MEYSKTAIKKAGEVLRDKIADTAKINEALEVLSYWRSLHAEPLNKFNVFLRSKIQGEDKPIIAQRLKRLPSILSKLNRFQDMSLDRMQDIAGIRVVFDNMNELYQFYKKILDANSSFIPITRENDYIKFPKQDGYKSLHRVFDYNGIKIEMQLRTRIQHAWATAVEVFGVIDKKSYKTGEGEKQYFTFFKLVSALFSYKEDNPVLEEYQNTPKEELIKRIIEIEKETNVIQKLKTVTRAIKKKGLTSSKRKNLYYLVELDSEDQSVAMIPFTEDILPLAEFYYTAREEKLKDENQKFVLLLSAGDMDSIQKAYPNYFLDTELFITTLEELQKN